MRVCASFWYGHREIALDLATGTALWYYHGSPRSQERRVGIRDPSGKLPPRAFLCTDVSMDTLAIVRLYVRRWCIEVTFEEVRPARPRPQGRRAPAHPERPPGRPTHPVDACMRFLLVRPPRDRARPRHRHGPLVLPRQPQIARAPGRDTGSERKAPTPRLPLHRRLDGYACHRATLRQALVHRGHLRRGQTGAAAPARSASASPP